MTVFCVHSVQNHALLGSLSFYQPDGPPCWASPLAFGLTGNGGMGDIGDDGKKACGHLYSFLFPGGNYGAGGGNGSLLHSSLCLLFLCLIIQACSGCLPSQFALGQDTSAY